MYTLGSMVVTSDPRMTDAARGDDVYARLLREIRSGALPAGMRLTETDLAARLRVSRTPVREAIRRLEGDGLVAHRPRLGAVVRRLDHAEVIELYEMRAVLEGTAARLAARAASAAERAELAAINQEMAAAARGAGAEAGPALAALNRQFHDALARAARNRFLLRSTAAVQSTLLLLGPTTLDDRARAAVAVAEHDAVLGAIDGGDGEGAEALMRRHIEGAERTRLRMGRAAPLDAEGT